MGRDRTGSNARRRTACTPAYYVEPYKRCFAVREADGSLVVVALYRKGAEEVVRRLIRAGGTGQEETR